MKEFEVEVEWTMKGSFYVEAENEDEADRIVCGKLNNYEWPKDEQQTGRPMKITGVFELIYEDA